MTNLTMRYIKDHFVVTGPGIAPMKFKSLLEAKDWCRWHHPRLPVVEIGRDELRRVAGQAGAKEARRLLP